jgi:plasmid stabilization system protein ParE
MSRTLIIRAEAQSDLESAKRWYDGERPGLGDDFLLCVEEAPERIRRRPHLYAVLRKDVRRAPIRRFPYGVFYRITADRIVVLGVLHGRRSPGVWQSRS